MWRFGLQRQGPEGGGSGMRAFGRARLGAAVVEGGAAAPAVRAPAARAGWPPVVGLCRHTGCDSHRRGPGCAPPGPPTTVSPCFCAVPTADPPAPHRPDSCCRGFASVFLRSRPCHLAQTAATGLPSCLKLSPPRRNHGRLHLQGPGRREDAAAAAPGESRARGPRGGPGAAVRGWRQACISRWALPWPVRMRGPRPPARRPDTARASGRANTAAQRRPWARPASAAARQCGGARLVRRRRRSVAPCQWLTPPAPSLSYSLSPQKIINDPKIVEVRNSSSIALCHSTPCLHVAAGGHTHSPCLRCPRRLTLLHAGD